jgi:membrane associated rhomboid family serine protease
MANYSYSYRGTGLGGGGFSLFSPTIKSLLIINVAVFALELFLGALTLGGVPVKAYLMQWFALQSLASGDFMPWQLVTYQFMHGGFLHLFFNMFALWMFGSELDSIWGGRRFLTFYLLSGIGAGAVQLGVSALLGSEAPTVGASGSINGLLIAFGFLFPDRPLLMFPIFFPIPAKIFVLGWVAIDFLSGITGADRGVAHFAHVGGALMGFLLLRFGDSLGIFAALDRVVDVLTGRRRAIPSGRKIYDIRSMQSENRFGSGSSSSSSSGLGAILGTKRSAEKTSTTSSNAGSSASSDAERTQEVVDRILDKIASTGYNSLSEDEKRILNEASKKL